MDCEIPVPAITGATDARAVSAGYRSGVVKETF